jgi:MFS family permease|tara:strand:+ start:40364 stop:41635 length:1272 start_codon:yes stop_codon:yes gene_type:complete
VTTTPLDLAAPGRFAAFSIPAYRSYWLSLVLTGFAVQVQTVAVGWYLYDLTRDPLDLGLVGLSQFLPALLLVLVTGSVADRFSRRTIMSVTLALMGMCAIALFAVTGAGIATNWMMFLIIALFGTTRAFYNPARQSLVPNIVPTSHLPPAVAANATATQFATICGPVAGGLLYAIDVRLAFGAAAAFLGAASLFILVGVPKTVPRTGKPMAGWESVSAGFRYVWTNKPVLGAISLDLFAVLFGGAMALLPVYARDVLDIGPEGLGLLRSGPAIGAIAMGLALIVFPIRNHAGKIMFAAVAGFGVATLVFALSATLWISLAALILIGAFDMISVNIRNVLIQIWTPDALLGRVNAVNQIFVGASNELGAFRAGVMATWIGPVAALSLGGALIIPIAAAWAIMFPQLRDVRHLDGRDEASPSPKN